MTLRLQHIWIYPIKSLDGLAVVSARITPQGALEHDRRYVLVDEQNRVLRAKQYVGLHRVRARFDLANSEVTLAREGEGRTETFHLHTGQPQISAWISNHLGMRVRLVRLEGAALPDDPNLQGPTVVSTGSLEWVAAWSGLEMTEVVRRFRVNLVVNAETFWEDRLVAGEGDTVEFRMGAVALQGAAPCSRCPVPARSSTTGELDASFTARFVAEREASMPAWTNRARMKHANYLTTRTCISGSEVGKALVCGDWVTVQGARASAAPPRRFAKFDEHAVHALTAGARPGAE